MFQLIAQAATTTSDAVPSWVGGLSGTALTGVLLYYLVTNALPKMQDRFHEAIEKERESREKMAEKTFEAHRESIKAIIQRDEKRHEQLMARLDQLPNMLRPQG